MVRECIPRADASYHAVMKCDDVVTTNATEFRPHQLSERLIERFSKVSKDDEEWSLLISMFFMEFTCAEIHLIYCTYDQRSRNKILGGFFSAASCTLSREMPRKIFHTERSPFLKMLMLFAVLKSSWAILVFPSSQKGDGLGRENRWI